MARLRSLIDPDREAAELRAYLGDAYDHERLVHYEAQLDDELAEIGDEQTLYRRSEGYLYNLTAFAMTGTKDPYRAWIDEAFPTGGRLLDVGCGIGADGLALMAGGGHTVTFADFDNPSVAYLRARLAQRAAAGAARVDAARIVDLDRDALPGGHDLAYAFDVLEHVEDPFALLTSMESSAALVLVNVLEPDPGETALHHELPVTGLLDHATRRGLVRYRRFHGGRSHLVLYRGAGTPAPGRLGTFRSRAVRAVGGRRSG
ncbi:MAG: putative S-adenosylmethionine-dependent methyltransferase [Solirubrobacterales bacterium]|nr:putative S-adenosylmethionine-dependent methyltransferase [Solirubrobacterales bacterium]